MFRTLFSFGSARRQIAANTAYQMIGKVIGAGTTFVVSFVLAKRFGASGFGDFIKITTYVSFFFLIADFGLNAIYIQRSNDRALDTLIGLRLLGGMLLMFASLAILSLLPSSRDQGYTVAVRVGIILFAPAIFFQALITTTNAVFQKYLRYDYATVSITVGSIVSLLIIGIIWYGGFGFGGGMMGVIALLMGSVSTAIVSVFFARRITTIRIHLSYKDMITLFVLSAPLGITLISNLIYAHVDSFILTVTRSTFEVGTYGLAYKIFETVLVVPTFFMNSVYPVMNKVVGQLTAFRTIIKKSLIAMGITSVCMTIGVWVFAPLLLFIKSDFANSVIYIRILALSFPFFFLSSVTMWVLISLKRQRFLVYIYGVGMLVNIFLNIWFIPIFGPLAASWITVVCEGGIFCISLCTALAILARDHHS